MVDPRTSHVAAWIVAGLLVLLLVLSFGGTGAMLGGVGMGWMIVVVLLLIGLIAFVAYQAGRVTPKV